MRFMDNDTLVIVANGMLEIFDAQKDECLYCFDLPKSSSSDYDVYCSPEGIFVISNTDYNTLWQVNFDEVKLEPVSVDNKIDTKYYTSLKLCSSPNGQHLIGIGQHKRSQFDYTSDNNIVFCKGIDCKLSKIKEIQWDNIHKFQISDDGRTLLALGYKSNPILIQDGSHHSYHYPIKGYPAIIQLSQYYDELETDEKPSNSHLSPRGNYVLVESDYFLTILNTKTKNFDSVICLKKDGTLAVIHWNNTLKQSICPNDSDTIEKLFSKMNIVFSKFSEDESSLLLVMQDAKPFEKTQKISIYVLDIKHMTTIWHTTIDGITAKNAAISSDGSMIALLDQDGDPIIKDLNDIKKD